MNQQKGSARQIKRKTVSVYTRNGDENKSLVDNILETKSFWTARIVGLFYPRTWEPDLLRLWSCRPLACVFPKVRAQDEMSFYKVYSLSDFAPGYRGILEPTQATTERLLEPADPLTEDCLLLVPGLAFDGYGGRLGSGGGFYDRFAAKSRAGIWGVGWFFQYQHDQLPQDRFDLKLQVVVTERGLLPTKLDQREVQKR